MATVTNEFHVTVKRPEPFKASVVTSLIQSNEVYKGEFTTPAELQKISAYSGDYADVFETNTRWVFTNGVWTNSEMPIPVNPILATKQDVSVLEEQVASLGTAASKDVGTAAGNVPVLDSNGMLVESVIPTAVATTSYVDDAIQAAIQDSWGGSY